MAANTFKLNGVTLAKSAQPLLREIRATPCRRVHTVLISIRCTVADKEFIRYMAKSQGLALQKFVMQAAMDRATL